MSYIKVYEDSKNYAGTVIRLGNTFPLVGLDNLVGTSVFGNTCIIPKSYHDDDLYVFFPSETQLSEAYLKANNLYRNSNLNEDQKSKGYFEDNGRIKAIKFKGNKSTGIVMPINSIRIVVGTPSNELKVGSEFNEIHGTMICRKYFVPVGMFAPRGKAVKILDEYIDSRMFPEHIDTPHLLKNMHNLDLNDNIVITIKMHGTSARLGHTLVKRKLSWKEKFARWFGVKIQSEEYEYVVGSRRVVKSIGFTELKNKKHFYEEDLWTSISKELFDGKLHKGEIVYFEIVGKDYNGAEIQRGYTYGFEGPKVFVYRISNINPQGVEIDLSWSSLIIRCTELGVNYVPTSYKGSLINYLITWANIPMNSLFKTEGCDQDWTHFLETHLVKEYLDKKSLMDDNIVEEGICLRVEKYPQPETYKLKSPLFLIHESKQADALVADVESQN